MAASITLVSRTEVPGARRRVTFTFTPSTAYPGPGGEPLSAASLGLTTIDSFDCLGDTIAGVAVVMAYDYVNSKLKAYVMATGAEVANAVDLSAHPVRCVVEGV